MKSFATRSQSQWGIPKEYISSLGWKTAIFELKGLEHNLTPSSQLYVLTRSIKAIFNEFKLAVKPKLEEGGFKDDIYIGADDLVPIFLYVFCQSNLSNPLRSKDLMWALCHPDQLRGESGYYLTIFESAIEFVYNEPLNNSAFAVRESLLGMNYTLHGQGSPSINPMHAHSDVSDGLRTGSMTAGMQSFDSVVSYQANAHAIKQQSSLFSSVSNIFGWNGREQRNPAIAGAGRSDDGQYAMRESFM